jgi:hypothetical protein
MATVLRQQANERRELTRDEVQQRLLWLRRFAKLSDEAIRIPGTSYTIGLDGILGLIPGVGDFATAVASLLMIHQAHTLGVRKTIILRMLGNVAIDCVVGAVPVLGDLFDFGWKANTRNLRLLEAELLQDGNKKSRNHVSR